MIPLFKHKVSNKELIKQHMKILKSLQYSSGLFAASKKTSRTGYEKSWLRDNFYECLAFERLGDWTTVKKTYRAILNIFLKHEYKIDFAIMKKPQFKHEYIHARYNPHTFDEYWDDWGNKQNDAVGAILFMIGELEHHKGLKILETEDDYRIVNKLVKYLNSIEYWHDEDSGMWEENEEVHASSIGACVAGLKNVRNIKGITVPKELIEKGKKALNKILPRESNQKFADLAQLSLIWPYNIVTKKQREAILNNIEYYFTRRKGIIRYKNDYYFNKNPDGYSEEAEWCFGFSWLAIIYENIGDYKKAKYWIKKAKETITPKGEIPELYLANSNIPGPNTPLGWAESLFIIALYNINHKIINKKHKKV